MISRVADHAFWLGRYVERTEATARLLATTHNLALDAELEPAQCWRPVIVVAGEEAGFVARHAPEGKDDPSWPGWGDGELVEHFLTWDDVSGVSLHHSARAARWNARSIREVVSLEVWETTNELYLWLASDAAQREFREERYAFYKRVRSLTQLTLGLLRSTMLHDEPLDFIWLGVLLERVSQTARILDVQHHAFSTAARHHEVVETSLWLSLLRSLGGFEPFMKKQQGRVTPEGVAGFLIGEDRFPRSVAYCVKSAYDRLCAIRPESATDLPGGETLVRLRALDVHLRGERGDLRDREHVHRLLTHVVDETHAICQGLGRELLGQG